MKSFIWLHLPWGLSHVDQRMHLKKKRKKLPISVFPTSMECHIQVFFSTWLHLKRKAHSMSLVECGWVFACMYVHWWLWGFFLSILVFCFFYWLLFHRSRKKNRCFLQVFAHIIVNIHQSLCVQECACVRRLWPPPPTPPLNEMAKPQIFTIHLCVYAAVKSTNTLINHTKSSKAM